MKIIMISNFMNHHQIDLCKALQREASSLIFYEYDKIPQERINLGYQNYGGKYDFIRHIDSCSFEKVEEEIFEADIVILGGTDISKKLIKRRIRQGKKVYRYSERIFKNNSIKNIARKIYYKFKLGEESRVGNTILLCAGSYVREDYEKIDLYKGEMFKWGYFPIVNQNIEIVKKGLNKSLKILWVGRFLNWKNPTIAIDTISKMTENNIPVELYMIGDGPMLNQLVKYSKEKKMLDKIHFIGSVKHDEVKKFYEKCDIFLFTSNKQEGWGAVLNEALSHGMIVISSNDAGATNYLIRNEYNGFIYLLNGNEVDQIFSIIETILKTPNEKIREMRINAFETINNLWSADIAAKRLLDFYKKHQIEHEGPMSRA